LLSWLADTRLARQVLEVVFQARSRRHLSRLDAQAPGRAQLRTLLGLVHQARHTPFAREHDFRRIRTAADFRRLVPLRSTADFWRPSWQPAFPHLDVALQSAHAAALRTALALVVSARPRARLLSGQLLCVAEDGALTATGNPDGDAESLARQRLPLLLRPHTRLAVTPAVQERDGQADALLLARRHAHDNVTCLVGPCERLLPLVQRVKQLRGAGRLEQVWPNLAAVLPMRRAGPGSAGVAARLRDEVGEGVLLLETLTRPEAPLAVEDPRQGGLRLLVEHGVYFEFIPSGEADRPHPTRLGVEEVQAEVPYELALTSPAGLWACRVGLTVLFERRDPPLIRLVWPAPVPAARSDSPALIRAPHLQSSGTRATLPETLAHSPWSAPADRG
jgi:hypothetical protein